MHARRGGVRQWLVSERKLLLRIAGIVFAIVLFCHVLPIVYAIVTFKGVPDEQVPWWAAPLDWLMSPGYWAVLLFLLFVAYFAPGLPGPDGMDTGQFAALMFASAVANTVLYTAVSYGIARVIRRSRKATAPPTDGGATEGSAQRGEEEEKTQESA